MVPVLLGGPEEEAGGRQLLDLDCFLSDISDTLFTMTQPSPSPLQLPPEDGEGLRVQAGGRGGRPRMARGRGAGAPTPSAAPDVSRTPAAYVGNADMIQPDLTPLQPSLDD